MDTSAGESSREKLRRRGRPLVSAFTIWVVWAAATIILFRWSRELAPLLASLLLGGLTCLGLALLLLLFRREVWRQRRQDLIQSQRSAAHLKNLIWLSARISPRRPLPIQGAAWEARPEVLSVAWDLIREHRPRHALELGSGLSSVVMAYALESNGFGGLLALENHTDSARNTRRLLAEHRLEARAQVRDAPLQQVEHAGESWRWYALTPLSPDLMFDFLFVDGPSATLAPMIRFPALPLLHGCLADDAVILVDDTHREPEREIVERWLEDFPGLRLDDRFDNKDFAVLRFGGRGGSSK